MEATGVQQRCSVIAAGHVGVGGVVGGRVEKVAANALFGAMLQFGASIHRINDD